VLSVNAQGIEFEKGNWEEVLEKAKQADKLMFVDSYTSWCGPCKKLSKNVFPNAEVGKFFNENFVNLKLNMEKENGLSFGRKYRVTAYPTMFFINGKGEVVYKITGYRNAEKLIEEAKTALSRFDRTGDFAKSYEEGERSVEFMIKYVNELNKTNKESLKISNTYIKENPNLSAEDKARFLFAAASESDSKLFEEMLKYDDYLISKYGQEEWNEKILSACSKTVDSAIEYEYPELIENATNQVKGQLGKKAAKKFECESCIEYYKSVGDIEEYQAFMKNYISKIAKKDIEGLTWAIKDLTVSFGGNKESLALALDAAKRLYKIDDSIDHGLLLARIHFEIGEQEESLELLEKVKRDIEESGKPTRHIDQIIEKIKAS
jgi:thioredoxin-related protein